MRKQFAGAAIGAVLGIYIPAALASSSLDPSKPGQALPSDLSLPGEFLQRIADRAVVDAYQASHHRVEPGPTPAPRKMYAARSGAERFIKIVRPQPGPEVNQYRSSLPETFVPLRGYRAPILEWAGGKPPALVQRDEWSREMIIAAECVARRLAHDGLLSTLAQVIKILGPDRFTSDGAAGLDALRSIGFPTDLLACFSPNGGEEPGAPGSVVVLLARRLASGATIESLNPEMHKFEFRLARTHRPFQAATESGEHELGMLRVQAGGGYHNGVIPGATIDVICQLVNGLPSVDFLISVPELYLEPFRQMASQTWRLRRTNHVTLISEPLAVASWAQDNGKAGCFTAESASGSSSSPVYQRPATLAPRYACIGEGQSSFEKGESFLMDGLQAAGHAVAQSPLLFQGGNLMAVRDPKSGERLLLIGEAELYRNIALGLTCSQALEAFKAEFGVDRCVAVPSVSYHLDFDVSLRAHDGELVAFVNDTMAATHFVIRLGLHALKKSGTLNTNTAEACRVALDSGRDLEGVRHLRTVIPRRSPSTAGYPASLSRLFASSPTDSGAGNFQGFLLAIDLLESSVETNREIPGAPDSEHAAYLQALRHFASAQRAQAEVFKNQGWKVVAIPSMSDLYRSINYLNGIHHRHGYVMPVFGGFYAPLDNAAMIALRHVLGSGFTITPILSAESQRRHGGVHCIASAYPKL